MKKTLVSILTAGLAIAMTSTYSVSAESTHTTKGSVIFEGSKSVLFTEATSNFTFDRINLDNNNIEQSADKKVSITIDDTTGTANGWEVTAKFLGFAMEDTTDNNEVVNYETLTNAKLSLKDPEAENSSNGELTKPSTILNGELNNQGQQVVKANKGSIDNFRNAEGLGTWKIEWTPMLYIPAAEANAGEHIGEIEWTLTNAE